jgi:hypothetical protein
VELPEKDKYERMRKDYKEFRKEKKALTMYDGLRGWVNRNKKPWNKGQLKSGNLAVGSGEGDLEERRVGDKHLFSVDVCPVVQSLTVQVCPASCSYFRGGEFPEENHTNEMFVVGV